VHYRYDPAGRLVEVSRAGKKFRYQYDSQNRMIGAEEDNERISNVYVGDLCTKQTWWHDGVPHVFRFRFNIDPNGKNRETDVTEPDGSIRRVKFNQNGYTTTDIYRSGRPDQITVTFNRDLQTNNLKDVSVSCKQQDKTVRLTTPIGPARSGELEADYLISACETPKRSAN